MAKWQLVTSTTWMGTEQYHDIDGDYETEEEALESFGGNDEAYLQALEDHCPEYHIKKVDGE